GFDKSIAGYVRDASSSWFVCSCAFLLFAIDLLSCPKDLIRRPNFANPFVLACRTRHSKLAGIGVVCLQRLVSSRALPPERLDDALGGLRETTSLSQDVQLKILQTLPSLLHNYSEDLSGELLANTLEICATLQATKTVAVANTAAATLQQLVVSAFEKVSVEDGKPQGSVPTQSVTVDAQQIDIGLAAYDALRILDDLCRLVEGDKLEFLQIKSLSPVFVLELIESILVNSSQLFHRHSELMQVLRNRLMPLTVRYLSERHGFPQTLRVSRILLILLRNYMTVLVAECEMALGLLIHLLEPDAGAPWKRVLCMEVFRGLHAEPGLIRLIYSLFDEVKGRKDIVKDQMASLVRLASEKPSLIGVSHQSTVPSSASHSRTNTEDQITLEAGGVAGVIGAAVNSADDNVTGISGQWSTVRTPYLELLDKSEPPPPPETYIYCLVLNCISALSEGLAKFILPLTVPDTKSKRKHRLGAPGRESPSGGSSRELQRTDSWKTADSKRQTVPLNPLDLEDHPQQAGIRACAGIIESCWPAILATCSTFLYAALDADFYHNLVRSFQKLTHVAGLLRQSTARDAFLTTLGKASMPIDGANTGPQRRVSTAGSEAQHSEAPDTTVHGTEPTVASQASTETPRVSFDNVRATLSTRNLLCLRALLNLGIALGPILDQPAWYIILETLQNADLVINVSAVVASKQSANATSNGESNAFGGSDVPKANLGAEIVAVQAAASKMFESTADYPDSSFEAILGALLNLSNSAEQSAPETPSNTLSPVLSPQTPRRMGRVHQNTRSISLAVGKSRIQDDELNFVLEKTSELARSNLGRFSAVNTGADGAWNILTTSLIAIIVNGETSPSLRLKASKVLNDIIFHTMKQGNLENEPARNQLQLRNLQTLKSQIVSLYEQRSRSSSSTADIDVHEQALDTLKTILEQHGESFTAGWDLVFDLVSSVFEEQLPKSEDEKQALESRPKSRRLAAKSPRLVRAAYSSLQLIASDFLLLLPPTCLLDLVNSFSNFASQSQDFNISLTTTTFFWNVSDFLQGQVGQFSIEDTIDTSVSEETLSKLAEDADNRVSRGSLWLLLLLRIVDLTTDGRSEIRNSAIRTLLRILDAYGQQLSPRAWHLCLNRVLFAMIDDVQAKVLNVTATSKPSESDEAKAWVETAVVMIKGCSDLIANFFDSIVQDDRFNESWKRLLQHFHVLVQVNIYELTEAAFSSLCDILARVQTSTTLSKEAVRSAWWLWANGHPALDEDSLNMDSPNQDALLAYFRSFQQIYRLSKEELTQEQIEQVLRHMRAAIWNSVSSRYSVDVDHQSALQELITQCIKAICLDMENSQPAIVLCLADFADAALSQWAPDRDRSRPTFVAFSKSSIDVLSWYIADFGIKRDIFTNGSLTTALEHLANPILQKYEWRGKDREPVLWRKATTASLDILRVAVPYVESRYDGSQQPEVSRFWRCVVDITRGIVSAKGCVELGIPMSTILSDESFDISAFNRLISLIIPSLGSPNIPDRLRRDFAWALFQSTLIYPPQRTDLPIKALEEEPLRGLYKVRRGRTYDPSPTARSQIAYVLIDTMFDLATASVSKQQQQQQGDSEGNRDSDSSVSSRISLARSISPYLILRASMPLKSYIADQPLRGLMPQPTSARKELLHLLRRMIELKSEPAAIPDAPAWPEAAAAATAAAAAASNDSSSPHPKKSSSLRLGRLRYRKHLGWVYPLVVKAVRVAGKEKGRENDGRVLEALVKVLHEVGDCSGVEEEDEDSDSVEE
ncbi:Endosomal peripheral membrane protein (Mon2), partial [Rasamsonia emersonii CBS 393.64]